MKLAKQVISTFEGPLDLANYKDEYREGLQRIIEANDSEFLHRLTPKIGPHALAVAARGSRMSDPYAGRLRAARDLIGSANRPPPL
jgi:hypothetical protein